MTAYTPNFKLPFLAPGQALADTRAVTQEIAEKMDAALTAGPASPPSAQSLAAVAGRVTTLEDKAVTLDAFTAPWTSYNPTWTATIAAPSIGNGTLTGKYLKVGRLVQVDIFLRFGSTSSGGNGDWGFTAPFPAAPGREHEFTVKVFNTAGNFAGLAYLPGGDTTVVPMAPLSASNAGLGIIRNTDASGLATSGIPAPAADRFSFEDGRLITIFGRYEAAE